MSDRAHFSLFYQPRYIRQKSGPPDSELSRLAKRNETVLENSLDNMYHRSNFSKYMSLTNIFETVSLLYIL